MFAKAFAVFAGILVVGATTVAGGKREPVAKVLLVTGENNHDWKATTAVLREELEDAGVKVVVTEEPATLETKALAGYDAILLNYNRRERWPKSTEQALVRLVRDEGKGLVVVHASDNAFPGWREFEEMIGLAWREGAGHDHYGPFKVHIVDRKHPITSGLDDFETTDELYRDLTKFSDFHVLATAHSKDKDRDYPILFVKIYGKGRVFHTVLGHDARAMRVPGFETTLVRGTLWAARKL